MVLKSSAKKASAKDEITDRTNLPPRPDWKALEKEMIDLWEKEETFKFDLKKPGKIYSIDTPPPTISGTPHIGHAFSYSQTEFIARYKRMTGWNVFYPFGYDNNGLPTERLAEKIFKVKANKMPREEFVKLTLKLTKEKQEEYKEIWKRLGISCDWNYCYSTISPRVQRISQLSFLKLHKKNRVYRTDSPTLYCPECQTAISQAELNDVEQDTIFYFIEFKLQDNSLIEIATTRPELLPSIVAVFVNPNDKRFTQLVGKEITEPLFEKKVKILSDHRVQIDQGSGIVMCCTFGDQTDVEWYKAFKLPYIKSIGNDGKMTSAAGKFAGLKIMGKKGNS